VHRTCIAQVYEEVEIPIVRVLAHMAHISGLVDLPTLQQELAATNAAAAAAHRAACALVCRTLDLSSRAGYNAALQAVQAMPPLPRRPSKGVLGMGELGAIIRQAGEAGGYNCRVVQMVQLLMQHQQSQQRAAHLHRLLEKLAEAEGEAWQLQSQGPCGVIRPAEEDVERLFSSTLELAGARLEISQWSVQDELLSGHRHVKVCCPFSLQSVSQSVCLSVCLVDFSVLTDESNVLEVMIILCQWWQSLNLLLRVPFERWQCIFVAWQDVSGCSVLVLLQHGGPLVCGTLLHTQAEPGCHLLHSGTVLLPGPHGGLEAALQHGMPMSFQQVPAAVQQLPCGHMWRVRKLPGSCAANSNRALEVHQLPANNLSTKSITGSVAGRCQAPDWAIFSWASGRRNTSLAASDEAVMAAGKLPAYELTTGHAGGNAESPDVNTDQRRSVFSAACNGSTAKWAAAHGSVWSVHTLRHVLR
jgi:hypothetical protein